MLELQTKHILDGSELSAEEILKILELSALLKKHRAEGFGQGLLTGKTLALLFDKPSLRTRMSFTVAMQELGGTVIESLGANRKNEEPRDVARVIGGYVHGIMIRTFKDLDIQELAEYSPVPVINGLSDHYHPCQTLADLLTMKEALGSLKGKTLAYIGDGNNILQSFFPMFSKLGVRLKYACPKGYEPTPESLAPYQSSGLIEGFTDPEKAVRLADIVYTDVWASMGFEDEAAAREEAFQCYQVNEELMSCTGKNSKVMHCLPMLRGKEISSTLPDSSASLIFQQSENRLHAQKALLIGLMANTMNWDLDHDKTTISA